MTRLPAFRTSKLTSVLVDFLQLHRGIGKMQYLEELSTISITPTTSDGLDSLDDVARFVNKSKQLRMLDVRFEVLLGEAETTYGQLGMLHFLDAVAVSKVQSLTLHDFPHRFIDFLVDYWTCTRPNHL